MENIKKWVSDFLAYQEADKHQTKEEIADATDNLISDISCKCWSYCVGEARKLLETYGEDEEGISLLNRLNILMQ